MKDKLHLAIRDKSYAATIEGRFLVLDEPIPYGPYQDMKRIQVEKHPLDTAGEVVNKTIEYLNSLESEAEVSSED